ncbi:MULTISPECIES: winged helix-turn-helix domain-containing protein [Herbaspirillum]|uniref:winged helix-turn-helix domain-containing protein n=1 Tax=Herbaspirillum TaxID=963 RepID=UPI0009810915|nr:MULTISPECIES: winged helix-turn-helix domain-containing protein [Herbaspirillum]MCI1013652.1 winged helix-turn-helix domain-containing protein [Herbaspirillum sp. C7C2]ONN64599.1 DNA-binding response regulator [Herbaspirillum sp. VT-16-41]QNB06579.1 response regulator [Herbaspirillum frisingense]UIN22758.1 winged helix-turn-helix domain-containing protein [Herbaspirillum frisingense]
MSKELAQILMVEDEPSIAELLRFTMQGAGFATTIATDVAQARKFIAEALPHVILLDWMLPDSSGLVLLSELRRDPRTAALPVIMLTAKGMEEDKVKGLNEGADDYVTKPFSPKELVARVQALLRRKTPEIGSQVLRYRDIGIDVERREVSVGGRPVTLDQAEFKLLRYLVAHPERIFSRAQLLDKVWGDHTFIEERTVDVHIMRLRKSLGDLAHYVQTVRGMGYKLSGEQ